MQLILQHLTQVGMTPSMLLAIGAVGLLLLAGIVVDVVLLALVVGGSGSWRVNASRIRIRPWDLVSAGPILAAAAVVSISLLTLGSAISRLLELSHDNSLLLAIFLQTLFLYIPTAAAILFSLRKRKLSLRSAFGSRSLSTGAAIGLGVVFYLGALPLVGGSAAIYRALLSAVGYTVQPQAMLTPFTDPGHSLLLRCTITVVAVALAPLGEEIFFRGITLPLLARHTNIFSAVCLVSAFFATIHFHIPSLVPLFVIASCFSSAYLVTGSILTPITMHILFNGISLAIAVTLKDLPGLMGS